MKITKQEVEHVAKLARLELSEQEKEKLTDQLSKHSYLCREVE